MDGGVEDPRRSNATRRDLREMLMIGLLSMMTGGRTCVDREAFGRAWEPGLQEAPERPGWPVGSVGPIGDAPRRQQRHFRGG